MFTLLRHPVKAWAQIEEENEGPGRLLVFYALPLCLIPVLSRAAGLWAFGGRDAAGPFKLPPMSIGLDAVLGYGLVLGALGILSVMASLGARLTRAQGRRVAGVRLAVYASTPGWLGGLLSVSPHTRFLGVVGSLYGIVLFAAGARALVRPMKGALAAYVVLVLGLFAAANAVVAGLVRLALSFS